MNERIRDAPRVIQCWVVDAIVRTGRAVIFAGVALITVFGLLGIILASIYRESRARARHRGED